MTSVLHPESFFLCCSAMKSQHAGFQPVTGPLPVTAAWGKSTSTLRTTSSKAYNSQSAHKKDVIMETGTCLRLYASRAPFLSTMDSTAGPGQVKRSLSEYGKSPDSSHSVCHCLPFPPGNKAVMTHTVHFFSCGPKIVKIVNLWCLLLGSTLHN